MRAGACKEGVVAKEARKRPFSLVRSQRHVLAERARRRLLAHAHTPTQMAAADASPAAAGPADDNEAVGSAVQVNCCLILMAIRSP